MRSMLSRKHEAGENRYAAPWSRRARAFTTTCNLRASAIEPASCPESTTEDEADM
jgi:hypothetical protein